MRATQTGRITAITPETAGAGKDALAVKRGEDRVADQLGDLGDYGVAEGSHSGFVQFRGNPIIASAYCGFNGPPHTFQAMSASFAFPSISDRTDLMRYAPQTRYTGRLMPKNSPSDFCGVGNHPDSFPLVGQSHRGRTNDLPFRIIPDAGQVSENAAKPAPWLLSRASKQVCDVLHDDEAWSYLANQSDDLRPKPASGAIPHAALLSGNGQVLAGEAPGDNIDVGNTIGSKSSCCEFSDILITRDGWPEPGKIGAAIGLDLAERDRLEAARTFEAKAKPSYAAEKIEDAKLAHLAPHHLGNPPVVMARERVGDMLPPVALLAGCPDDRRNTRLAQPELAGDVRLPPALGVQADYAIVAGGLH